VTVSVMLGLSLQFVAAWLVHVAIRGQWLRHVGALMLLMAVTYQGITEVMYAAWPGRDRYRWLVSQDSIDRWVLLVSVAITLYAVGLVVVLRLGSDLSGQSHSDAAALPAPDLKLKWLLALAGPLIVLTLQGHGALSPSAAGTEAARNHYAATGLAGQYLIYLVGIIGALALIRYGTRLIVPLLAAEAALLAGTGMRAAIVIACALTLYGAALAGVRPTRRQVVAVALVVGFFFVTISATRVAAGRDKFYANQGTGGRVSAILAGAVALPSSDARAAVVDDVIYRFDANAYGALIYQELRHGTPAVELATVKNNLLLGVPSFIYHGKLSQSLADRNEENYLDLRFGLNPYVDWIPGMFGTMVAYFGPLGLLALATLFGAGMGLAEVLLTKGSTAARFLATMGLAQCALLYEGGPTVFVTTLRGALVFAVATWAVGVLRRTWHRRLSGKPVGAVGVHGGGGVRGTQDQARSTVDGPRRGGEGDRVGAVARS
jgi:hypothetical protein